MSTLPKPTRPWSYYDAAVSVTAQAPDIGATNKRVLRLTWATARTNGLFALDYGCDSVTAGTKGDHVDRITADGNIVGATPGVAHSWWVDSVLGGTLGQICFDRDGTFEGSGSLFWSPSVGFTGGSTTARPTASDEREITHTSNILSTTQGDHVVEMLKCTATGQEGVRIAITNTGTAAGPVALFSLERPAGAPAAWTNPIIGRWMGGAGTFGNRGDWTADGWVSVIAGTTRVLTLLGLTPQVGTDLDGDVLLDGSRLTNATTLDVGYVDDFWWHDDAINALMGYSSPDGTHRHQAYDEVVWPHGGGDRGGGNTAGAKLRVIQQPAGGDTVSPVVTLVSPAAEGELANTFAPLVFDVTDLAPGLRTVTIHLLFDSSAVAGAMHTVYMRDSFQRGYSGTVTAIANGLRFSVNAPAGPVGWPGAFRIYAEPVDAAGNIT